MGSWSDKGVVITGGGGFLGSFVAERLKKLNCKNVFIPRSRDYNLIDIDAVKRVYKDANLKLLFIWPQV